jgi:hypothetical protein
MTTSPWLAVNNALSLSALFNFFGNFHDSCICAFNSLGDYSVGSDLTMNCPPEPDLRAIIRLQRQSQIGKEIELLFLGVEQFVIAYPRGFDRIILGATVSFLHETVVWSPQIGYLKNEHTLFESSCVIAKEMYWRESTFDSRIDQELQQLNSKDFFNS